MAYGRLDSGAAGASVSWPPMLAPCGEPSGEVGMTLIVKVWTLALDIGGTRMAVGLVGPDGAVAGQDSIPTHGRRMADDVWEDLAALSDRVPAANDVALAGSVVALEGGELLMGPLRGTIQEDARLDFTHGIEHTVLLSDLGVEAALAGAAALLGSLPAVQPGALAAATSGGVT